MEIRLRLFVIGMIGLVVAAVWSFPTWWPAVRPGETQLNIFPGISQEKQARFIDLRPEVQKAYFDLEEEDPELALALVDAAMASVEQLALSPELLDELDQLPVFRSGSFTVIDENIYRGAGTARVLVRADQSRILVFDNDFRVTNGPGLKVVFSRDPAPLTGAQVGVDYIEAIPADLQSAAGGQVYEIFEGVDFDAYQSVVIYSPEYNLVFTVASLR